MGSPRINTDANGNVIARHDYLPFGEEIYTPQRTSGLGYTADNTRQKFATYERDNESELDFAQARYYSSKLGRFYSVDPENAGASEDDPQSWNGYVYAGNNPVLFTDPDGLDYKVCYVNGGGCFNYTNEAFATYLKDIGGVGFVAKGEARNGSIYDTVSGDAIATFTHFTTADQDAVAALTGGAEPLLSVALPILSRSKIGRF